MLLRCIHSLNIPHSAFLHSCIRVLALTECKFLAPHHTRHGSEGRSTWNVAGWHSVI
jgi:hypothetical protein